MEEGGGEKSDWLEMIAHRTKLVLMSANVRDGKRKKKICI